MGPKYMATCSKVAYSSRTKPARGWAAAATGLICLGGMIKPADAFPDFFFDPGNIYSRRQFDDGMGMLASSHRARRHTDSATGAAGKGAETAKKEPPKPPAGPLIIIVSIGS